MHKVIGCVLAASILACTDHGSPTQAPPLSLAPRTLTVTATSRVISGDGGARALEVSALVKNETDSLMGVAVEPNCPLFVRIAPDPTGEPAGYTAASDFCAVAGAMRALAPGESAVLTRVIDTDSLAAYGEGTFGVNASVSTSNAVIGVWAGAVQLPLSDTP